MNLKGRLLKSKAAQDDHDLSWGRTSKLNLA